MKEYIQSTIEATTLLKDGICTAIGSLVAKADEWLCDYGEKEEL